METIFECTKRLELARKCLILISNIAARGACSDNSGDIGFALTEISQALFERSGSEEILFEPVSAEHIQNLDLLLEELTWIGESAKDQSVDP